MVTSQEIAQMSNIRSNKTTNLRIRIWFKQICFACCVDFEVVKLYFNRSAHSAGPGVGPCDRGSRWRIPAIIRSSRIAKIRDLGSQAMNEILFQPLRVYWRPWLVCFGSYLSKKSVSTKSSLSCSGSKPSNKLSSGSIKK